MFKHCLILLSIISFASSYADEAPNPEQAPVVATVMSETPVIQDEVSANPALDIPFSAFTGKVKGKKVRLRLKADLESQIVKELGKNDLLTIIGEKGDFFAVEPPTNTKAYVFRRFVIDNEVEGNKVNVRLEPSLESPVIGHLNAGEKVNGIISTLNNKWLEIVPPSNTQFFIAKDFIENVGGPEYKERIELKRRKADESFDKAALITKNELEKSFEEIDIDEVNLSYSAILDKYTDFPEYVNKAKEALTLAQEAYLQKKLAYLEMKKEEAASETVTIEVPSEMSARMLMAAITDKMKLWEPVEEALYLTWAQINDDKSTDDYYEQQKVNPVILTGIVEAYTAPVRNKPGDFIIRDKDIPVGYLYSTKINLQEFVGKKVTAIAAQRPNNNFAFPAFYVLSVE